MGEKAMSTVTFTIEKALNKATDSGPHRAKVKAAIVGFVPAVFGQLVGVHHNIEGAKNNRSRWTVEASVTSLADLPGSERRKLVTSYKETIEKFAKEKIGPGAKITLEVVDPEASDPPPAEVKRRSVAKVKRARAQR